MFHQIRKMMADDKSPLSGEIEVDETYVGGEGINKRYEANFNQKPKQVVVGMVKHGGEAKVGHVISSGARSLLPQIQENVEVNSKIYSDQLGAYITLPKLGLRVNHMEEYVDNDIHT